jgi:tetratricopeptide (TPR) repeat protein
MPRLVDLASAPTARRSRFIGRVREVHEFRSAVRYVLGKEAPPGDSPLFPHIFLLHGEGGMGKSMLLQRFRTVALDEGWSEGRILVTDLDYQQFSTPEALAQMLVERISDRFRGFDESYQRARDRREQFRGRFREVQSHWTLLQTVGSQPDGLEDHCRRLRERLREIERQAVVYGSAHMPLDLAHNEQTTTEQLAWLAPYADNPTRVPATFDEFLQREMGSDATLFRAGEAVGKALADDLYRIAETAPLLLAIDTYERADQHDDWLRTNMLSSASSQTLVVVAGRNRLDDGYRRTFVGDLINRVRSYNLNDQTFQAEEVREYLRLRLNQTQDLEPALVDQVLAISRGVPVAVEALGDQLADDGTLGPYKELAPDALNRRAVVRTVTARFLRYALDEDTDSADARQQKREDRQHIRSLAMLRRPDAELACAFWNVPADAGQARVDRLAERHLFIFAGYGPYEIHDLVRGFVREDTLTAGRQTFDWSEIEAGLRRALAKVEDRHAQLVGAHADCEEAWTTNPEKRFEDPGWQAIALDRLNALLWLGENDTAQRFVLGLALGGRAFAANFGEQVVSLAQEVAPRNGQWLQLLDAVDPQKQSNKNLLRFSSLLDGCGIAVLNYLLATPAYTSTPDWLILNDAVNATVEAEISSQVALLGRALVEVPGWGLALQRLASAHVSGALIHYKRHQYIEALAEAEAAFQLAPAVFHDPENVLLARLRWLCDNARGAVTVLDNVLTDDPDDVYALHNRAHARAKIGDLPGAINDFMRCQQLQPNEAEHIRCCAWVKQDAGDHPGALAELDRALALKPDDIDLLEICATVKRAAGDYPGALAELDRALALKPDDIDLLKLRNGARGESGDFAGAIADLERILKQKPNELGSVVRLALRKYQLVGTQATEPPELDALAKRNPEDSAYMMGCLRAHQGKREEALRWLEQELLRNPDQGPWMARDPDLRPLHDDPDFQALIRGDSSESASPSTEPNLPS